VEAELHDELELEGDYEEHPRTRMGPFSSMLTASPFDEKIRRAGLYLRELREKRARGFTIFT
jgi:hypothetical protein